MTALAVTTGAILVGRREYRLWQWQRQQQELYGTVQNPKFSIVAELPPQPSDFAEIETAYSLDLQDIEDYNSALESLRCINSSLTSQYESLQENYQHALCIGDADQRQQHLRRIARSCWDIRRARVDMISADRQMLSARMSERLDSISHSIDGHIAATADVSFEPQEYMRMIFCDLTSNDFPSSVIFVHEEQREGIDGYHSPLENKISSEGFQNIRELLVLLHEAGHLVAQHSESYVRERISYMWFRDNPRLFEVKILEEACAYAFTDAGIRALSAHTQDSDTALLLKIHFESEMRHLADKYFAGETDNEHYGSAALFYAARRILQNPCQVFNTLATVNESLLANVPEEISQELERERQLRQSDSTFDNEYRELYENMTHTFDRIDALGNEARAEERRLFEETHIRWLRPEEQR